MSVITGKKILFFAPKYFNYEQEITNMMENMGAEVEYFDERPKNSFYIKACLRLNIRFVIRRSIEQYYNNILLQITDKKYDVVFFVNPEAVPKRFLKALKLVQKDAKFLVYMWDSLINKKNTINILKYFDKAYTFDNNDAENVDNFNFLPLFYIPTYEKNKFTAAEPIYDLCFIGTAHGDRYDIISNLKEYVENNGLRFYSFLFVSSKLLFFVRKYITKELKKSSINDFAYNSISNQKITEIIHKSKVVIDIESPNQIGLTMRTFELLAMKKRMITTNTHIRNYDFYNKNNIYILNRDSLEFDQEWLGREWENIPKDIVEKYSLKSWLTNIFTEHPYD